MSPLDDVGWRDPRAGDLQGVLPGCSTISWVGQFSVHQDISLKSSNTYHLKSTLPAQKQAFTNPRYVFVHGLLWVCFELVFATNAYRRDGPRIR